MIKKIIITLLFAFTALAQQNQFDQNQFLLAESYEQRGDLNKAIEIVEPLYNKEPNNIQYFNKLNSLYLQTKRYDASVLIIKQRIQKAPQDVSLYGMLGSTYYQAGDVANAYKSWDEAISKFESNSIIYRVIANYVIERRDFEKAIEILKKGQQHTKDPFLYSYDLGELYSLTMRYKEAAEEYCKLIKDNPAQFPQIESKMLSYSNKPGALDETIKVVEDYQGEQDVNFNYLLAHLYLSNKEYEKAFETYKAIDKKQSSNGAEIYSFANLLLQNKQYDTASKTFEYIIQNYNSPNLLPAAKLGYSKTSEAILRNEYDKINPDWKPFSTQKKFDAAKVDPVISAYEEIIKIYKNSEVAVEANFRIASLLLKLKNDPDGAKNYFNVIVENYPTSKFAALAYIAIGEIEIEKGELDEAQRSFEMVGKPRQASPDDKSYAAYQLARIYSYRGDFDKSRAAIAGILTNLKSDIANDALQYSLILNAARNDSSNLTVFCKAEFLSEQKRFSDAKDLYQQLANNPQAFIFQSIAKIRAAEMMIAQDDYKNAIGSLISISEEAEKNIYSDKALYLLGNIYQYAIIDYTLAVETYEKLLLKFPKSIYLDEAREKILSIKNKIS